MSEPVQTGGVLPGEIARTLERLEAALSALADRVGRLEASAPPAPARVREPEKRPAPAEPSASGLSEEEILAVSAALAAYLGVRLRIRQIRLVSSTAWAQQGRVSIQASHRLHG